MPAQAWTAFRAALTKFERSKIVPEIAVRNAIGFTAAIVIATIVRSPTAGVIAGTGALNVSYSDSRDPYGLRARRILVAAVLTGLAVTLGSLSGHTNYTAVMVATLWAFASGMMVALGTIAGDLGVITLVTVVVFAARPLPPMEALEAGLTAFGGGLLLLLLSIALWPVRRYEPERRIVSDLYAALARMARSPVPPSSAPPFGTQMSDAQESLASLGAEHGIEAERLFMLLNQAERIRISILTLARLVHRIARSEHGQEVSVALHRALLSAADTLDSISTSTLTGKAPPKPVAFTPLIGGAPLDAQQQLDALGGQLRTACGVVALDQDLIDSREPWQRRFTGRLAKLQANLSINSTVFRHAVRLAVCLGLGDAIGRAISLQRTYWIPMTIAIVLKPDFTTTFSRGALRIGGTLAGLALATGVFHFVHAGPVTDIALMAVFMFLLRWIGPANYGIFVTALSALVVLLVASTGVAPKDVISARAINTAVGGLLAMITYALWPTWEKTQVGPAIADMLDAYRDYFGAVVAALAQRGDAKAIDRVRTRARRARSNAEASVDRLGGEPGVAAATIHDLQTIMVSSHSFVHAVMALESAVYRTETVPARPATLRFAAAADVTLQAAAAALRSGQAPPHDLPDLRAAHNEIAGSKTAPAQRYELVNVETDRITTSLNTMMEHLGGVTGRVR
jgi:uncharacterized membrane protein YccC